MSDSTRLLHPWDFIGRVLAVEVKIEFLYFRFVDFLFPAKKKRLKSLDFFQAEWLLGKITLLVSEIFETKEMCTIIWSLALTILKTVVPWYSRGIHFRTPQGYKNLWMLKSLR